MIRLLLLASILLTPLSVVSTASHACGSDSNCDIGDRHYRILMPESHNGTDKIGAIVYAHGYRGTAKGMMNNQSMAEMANKLGVAIIATKSYEDDWRIPGVPRNTQTDGKIELTYFDAVIEDATQRFPIDQDRLMATGFSAGGMMVWNLICHRSQLFAGFAPMAGTFWEPEPKTCDTPPASVVHIHGESDKIVPLMGRPIVDAHQGQIPEVLDMYSTYGGYKKNGTSEAADLRCENAKNTEGEILNFCLHPGGHSFKSEYVRHAWETLEKAGKL
ncbi:MAG: prolyl oligopeptidase family serine peptidase [Pseudomonadota bacterium]